MYGYYKYAPSVTQEEILSKVSQEDIFKIVIKEDIILDKGALYRAPYRDDKHPDCYFERYNGVLYFKDYADFEGKASKDCFNMLERCFNINYYEALKYVNDYFNLELGDSSKEEIGNTVEESNIQYNRKKITITFAPRPFSNKDKNFWAQYEISRDNLVEDKVIPITMYKSMSRKGTPFLVKPFDIVYAYTDFPDNKVKIYRPHSPTKEGKWFTNCNQNDIGCINALSKSGDLLIITKSYKDCRVLRNQGLNSVWIQSEGVIPSVKIIKDLCERFTNIVVWFDNDQTGLARAKALKDYINGIVPNKANTVFLPPKLFKEENIKDPSDYIASKGRKALRDFLVQKQLLHES